MEQHWNPTKKIIHALEEYQKICGSIVVHRCSSCPNNKRPGKQTNKTHSWGWRQKENYDGCIFNYKHGFIYLSNCVWTSIIHHYLLAFKMKEKDKWLNLGWDLTFNENHWLKLETSK